MKILKYVLISAFALAILYVGAIFLGFDLPKPAFLDKGIEGKAVLKVTLLMDNNNNDPVSKTEVDVALKPGQPPKGGVAFTDEAGVATFNIKPGTYSIYFNENSFPNNLAIPEPQSITVVEEGNNETTFLIDTKKQ